MMSPTPPLASLRYRSTISARTIPRLVDQYDVVADRMKRFLISIEPILKGLKRRDMSDDAYVQIKKDIAREQGPKVSIGGRRALVKVVERLLA